MINTVDEKDENGESDDEELPWYGGGGGGGSNGGGGHNKSGNQRVSVGKRSFLGRSRRIGLKKYDSSSDEAEEEEDEEEIPTKKSAILRGGVSRRALDLLLMKIGYKGFYPLGVFILLFYANAIAKMYIPLTTFAAWLPHHCCKVNGTLVEVEVMTINGPESSFSYHENWSFNDRKHKPDPPPKTRLALDVPTSSSSSSSSKDGFTFRHQHHRHRQQRRHHHRLDDFEQSVRVRLKDDENVCSSLVQEYGWRYATQPSYSLVADLDLGCRNATHLAQISNALFMIGFGIGGPVHGVIADLYGRKTVLVYSTLFLPVVGGITAAWENEAYYITMRFVQGFFQGGVLLSSSTMICELFPSSMRAIPHLMCQMSNVVGFFTLDLTSYLERRWRVLLLILPVFFVGVIPFVCVIPESLEWLFMTGQLRRACRQLQQILDSRGLDVDVYEELFSSVAASHKESRVPLSFPKAASYDSKATLKSTVGLSLNYNDGDIDDDDDDNRNNDDADVAAVEEEKQEEVDGRDSTDDESFEKELLLKMASTTMPPSKSSKRSWSLPTIVVVVAVACLTLINYFVYYGLVFSTDEFTGDRYLNFTLFALADLAGVVIAVAVINSVQRRVIICGCYGVIIVVAGAILIIDFVLDGSNDISYYDQIVLGGHLVIKIHNLAAVSVIELSSVEMPPTAIRSIASGIFFACKGLAGVTASFVSFLLRVDSHAETVFLVLASVAVALVFALPEMKNATIPRDANDLRENYRNTDFKYACLN